ncbi:MAG TPA: MarR family winged helix-turn-helix transcriptional regulator [Phenylobacterium sp.]
MLQRRPEIELLEQVERLARQLRTTMAARLPVSPTTFQVLQALADGAETSPAGLAAMLGLGKPALTAILQRLQADGLVTVEAHASDGRRKSVKATAAGLALHREAQRSLRPYAEALRARFPENDCRAVLPMLAALSAFLSELSAPDAPAGVIRR